MRDLLALALPFLLSCGLVAAEDRSLHVNIATQRLTVFSGSTALASFPVSTSRFGLGDEPGSYKTPLGRFVVTDKAGARLPNGLVIKRGRATREVLAPNAYSRDAIVTRVIYLAGVESHNSNAAARGICIHGTPEERTIGTPSSYGCIRLTSQDVVKLFELVEIGTRLQIEHAPSPKSKRPKVEGITASGLKAASARIRLGSR